MKRSLWLALLALAAPFCVSAEVADSAAGGFTSKTTLTRGWCPHRATQSVQELRGNRQCCFEKIEETSVAIIGAHYLLYSNDPDADRAFFRDVLNFRSVDLGHNWLIFALPPAEMAVHPGDFAQRHADHHVLGSMLYLMCDDLRAFIKFLASKNVSCTEIEEADWGIKTTIRLPSGGEIGLYQPSHQTAI